MTSNMTAHSLPEGVPSTAAVSQVNVPQREYKFVGAFSRKRRRKATSKVAIQEAAPTPARTPNRERKRANLRDSLTTARVTPEKLRPGLNDVLLPTADALPLIEVAPPSQDVPLVEDDGVAGADEWACDSLMSPFDNILMDFNELVDPFQYSHQPFPAWTDAASFGQLCESLMIDSPLEPEPSHDDNQDVNHMFPGQQVGPSTFDSFRPKENISHVTLQILKQYDQEFCVLPLTHDFEANPFRFDIKTGRGCQLLLHCILAISYKHINCKTGKYSREAQTHKSLAFQLLQDVENDTVTSSHQTNVLDALLMLITLDCATSANGPWTWYLKRAQKLIGSAQSPNVQESPRVRARIGMLVWWDVTLALTTRKGCVLSEATAFDLQESMNTNPDSTFYSISGCPHELFGHMIRLASFAREFELASTMLCVKFDLNPVLEAATKIREWHNPKTHDYVDSAYIKDCGEDCSNLLDLLQHQEDIYHCAEAWRYALLLYIERVFTWRFQPRTPILELLARRALNHVSACRRTSMVQKQLLLPGFLAACETTDQDLQQEARLYCQWWNEKTRYDMFLTVEGLLDEIWSNSDPCAWWGSILNQKAREGEDLSGGREYLFG